MTFRFLCFASLLSTTGLLPAEPVSEKLTKDVKNHFKKAPRELLTLENDQLKIGIDRAKGASITWLSWKNYPRNTVNEADPGRLIQQSYYAGASLNRQPDGQHAAWSPWPWNPIQGGGVGSWAKVNAFRTVEDKTLYSETVPKLWDMTDEDAEATMKQWTSFESAVPNTIVVRCLFESLRRPKDRWGPAVARHQEVPACYFTRNFEHFQSYLGEGKWRDETQVPGPPWGKATPPRLAMACFESGGQGIAIFSPTAGPTWNFGPHSHGKTDNPKAGPCVHIAPISKVKLTNQASYDYRYWLTVGTREELAKQLDTLWTNYSSEEATLSELNSVK